MSVQETNLQNHSVNIIYEGSFLDLLGELTSKGIDIDLIERGAGYGPITIVVAKGQDDERS